MDKKWRKMKIEFTYYINHIYSFHYRVNRMANLPTVTQERPGFWFK